jgi:toxin YoeB
MVGFISLKRNPFEGIGRREPLRFLGIRVWSRRLIQEHRIVYVVDNDRIDFIQCRYYY